MGTHHTNMKMMMHQHEDDDAALQTPTQMLEFDN
jgi:hypothetical protein